MRHLPAALALGFIAAVAWSATIPPSDVKPAFKSDVTIKVEGAFRLITSNGIPDHNTGHFPGPGNPNTIAPQNYDYRVPAEPKPADKPTALGMRPFGIAVNGVVFDPTAAEWWNHDRNSGWQYEPLMMAPMFLGADASHGHVQPNGAYHYHGIPTALVFALTGGKDKMVIVGWAGDGFPIYNNLGHTDPKDIKSPLKLLKSCYGIKKGTRPAGPGGAYDGKFVEDYQYTAGTGDLDECNGRFEVTTDYPQGIYHYVLTENFPYVPRFFKGTPDASFGRHQNAGGGPPGQGGPGQRGPRAAPGFHLIPRFAEEKLDLSDEQRQKVADLEKSTQAELGKILTAEQMKTLLESHPPGGPGGGGGGGGGGQGGGPGAGGLPRDGM